MTLHNPAVKITGAEEALQLLKEGNARFVSGKLSRKNNYPKIRVALTGSQQPFAIVLCCSDSRVAPEIYFDMKLGDIFVIRNAGNVVDDVVLGSIEYGTEHLGSPLVVVVGHTSCGAVTAAVQGTKGTKSIGSIIKKIRPSIGRSKKVNDVAKKNAKAMAKLIREDEVIRRCRTKVAAAVYDITTGEVSWL